MGFISRLILKILAPFFLLFAVMAVFILPGHIKNEIELSNKKKSKEEAIREKEKAKPLMDLKESAVIGHFSSYIQTKNPALAKLASRPECLGSESKFYLPHTLTKKFRNAFSPKEIEAYIEHLSAYIDSNPTFQAEATTYQKEINTLGEALELLFIEKGSDGTLSWNTDSFHLEYSVGYQNPYYLTKGNPHLEIDIRIAELKSSNSLKSQYQRMSKLERLQTQWVLEKLSGPAARNYYSKYSSSETDKNRELEEILSTIRKTEIFKIFKERSKSSEALILSETKEAIREVTGYDYFYSPLIEKGKSKSFDASLKAGKTSLQD